MALVTLATAKAQLRVSAMPDAEDDDIQRKLDQAEAIILDYLKVEEMTSPPVWTVDTVPLVVKSAILYQLTELYRFRGDDPQGEGPDVADGYLSPWVTNVLRRYRDPALA